MEQQLVVFTQGGMKDKRAASYELSAIYSEGGEEKRSQPAVMDFVI